MTLRPPNVVLLDRDGVINQDSVDYIKSIDEWRPIPGSLDAIARLHNNGFKLGIVTNQSAVGRGMISVDTLWGIHRHMLQQILNAGGFVERIFFCLHTPDDNCDCRKPKPGLLIKIARQFEIDLSVTPFVGDNIGDIRAAELANAKPVLVRTGNGEFVMQNYPEALNITVYDDLSHFTRETLKNR